MTVSLPAGSLPPGTTILIINAGNGYVLSFTVGNDGGAEDTLPATINDRLLITITDPFGNVTTFERSQFVNPATGETAVGPGGGVVTATDGSGVELRIPADATDKGVTLKIAGLTAADLAAEFPGQQPDLPGATVGSGLKIESQDKPTFKKEIDLVFPKPADAPDGAFYYVFRRIARPDGTALFETIDHAFVECPAGQTSCPDADKKVVTASWPMPGYITSFGALTAGGALAAVAVNYAFLMWTFDSLLPGQPSSGTVTGKVYRAAWASGGAAYLPEPFAIVTVVDSPGNTLAVSQRDGTFTAFDPRYTGGPVTIEATRPARTEDDGTVIAAGTERGTAFQAIPADYLTSGLRYYRYIASGNVTFPASAPPQPPPAIRIRLWKDATPRTEITTDPVFIVAGTDVVATFDAGTATNLNVTLGGDDCVVTGAGSQGEVDFGSDPRCTITQAGTYTVIATALPPVGGAVTASKSFIVVASAGENNTTPRAGAPFAAFVPRNLATGIAVDAYPQVTFSEPVVVGRGLRLTDGSVDVAVRILGVTPAGAVVDLSCNPPAAPCPTQEVTSITIQPTSGLRYSQRYSIVLDDTVRDTDAAPGPYPVAEPRSASFTTFGPESVGGTTETFGSPGIAVMDDRAYLVENFFSSGIVKAFDVSDPVAPQEIESARASVTGRPVDVVGAKEDSVTSGRLLAVATSSTSQSKPSNLYVFDVSSDAQTRWIGAASLTSSALDGFINRIAVHNGFAYSATHKKGIQVVDLARARDAFQALGGTSNPTYWTAIREFNTDGQGWGHDAVVQTIRLNARPSGLPWYLSDLKVADLMLDGTSQAGVVGVGEPGLVIANPQTGSVVYQAQIQNADASARLTWGEAVALGQLSGGAVAVVVGNGTIAGAATPLLMTVSLADPRNPSVLGVLDLRASDACLTRGLFDVLVSGDRALVGGKECVGVIALGADGSAPSFAGVVTGVGGRLAVSPSGLLFSTARSVFGGSNPMGGVRTAALGSVTIIQDVRENPVIVAENRRSVEPQRLRYRSIPAPDPVETSEIELVRNDAVVYTAQVSLDATGGGEFTLPAGIEHPRDTTTAARLVVNRADPERPRPLLRALKAEAFVLLPDEPLSISADEDPLDIAGLNQAVLARLSRASDPPFTAPTLSWLITGGAGGEAAPAVESPATGLYVSGFKTGVMAGEQQQLVLDMPGVALGGTLGRTAFITVTPGRAAVAGVRAEAPPQAPGLINTVPADGHTEVELVVDIRDAYANLVADGTLVSWSVFGDGGTILEAQTSTVNGRATSRYKAGTEPGQVLIKVAIDDKEWLNFIQQEPLRIDFVHEAFTEPYENFTATVRWGAGIGFPVADGAPVEWMSIYGVTGWRPIVDGVTTARWSPTITIPSEQVPATSTVTVAVGRARGGKAFEIRRQNMRLWLERQLLAADAVASPTPDSGGASKATASTAAASVTTETRLRVEGGTPGEVVTLTLGSTHSPAVQAVAEWPLDDAADALTGDVYGGPAAQVPTGVTVDQETLAVQGSSLRLDGSGGLAVTGAPYLDLSTNFGVGGWVRLDSLQAGQKILEKAGSYTVTVVEQSGEPRLEFTAVSRGVQTRVLSPQALAAATWYHFSAQWKDGRLRLAVGSNREIGLSDPIGPVDPSSSPLVFGPTLVGNLDHLQFHDLTRPALVAFPGGGTEIALTLDAEGNAETTVTATGAWQDPGAPALRASAATATETTTTTSSPGAGPSGQNIPIQYHVALDPPRVENYGHHLGVHTGASLSQCAEGIATGENDEWSGIGCDIALSFAIPLEIPLALRDLTVSLKNVVKGKASVATYIAGAFAILSIIPKRLPVVGPVLRRLSRAADAINVPWVKKKLADKALDASVEAAEGVVRTADEDLVKIAAGEAGEDARAALSDVTTTLDSVNGPAAWDSIEDLARACRTAPVAPASAAGAACYAPVSLLVTLRRIRQTAGLGVDPMRDVVRALRLPNFPSSLSSDALEGIAVFARQIRGGTGQLTPIGRIARIVDDVRRTAPPERQREVIENLFTWIKQGDAANIPGWGDFLRKGPGTLPNATHGAYHVLEFMSRELSWRGIRELEVRVADGERFLDIVMTDGRIFELKNLLPGRRLSSLAQIAKDVELAKERARRLTRSGSEADPDFPVFLQAELSKLNYVFRGTRQDMINGQPVFEMLLARPSA